MTQYRQQTYTHYKINQNKLFVIQNDLTAIRLLWLLFKVHDTYISLFTDSLFDYGTY